MVKKNPWGLAFHEVYNVTHVTEFLDYGFYRELLSEEFFDGVKQTSNSDFNIAGANKVVTALRIT